MPVGTTLLVAILFGGQATAKTQLELLRSQRKWLYEATHDRKDSGYFGYGEASPDGLFFPIGKLDRLYYCSLYVDDNHPKNDRVLVTCWVREGKKPRRLWQVKLLPGKQAVHGTLLSHACATSFGMKSSYSDPKTGKWKTIEHSVDGFHPDRASAQWKVAHEALESTQVLVHYHFNQHGDATLGHSVDLHGDQDRDFGGEPLDRQGHFIIPKAEIKLMAGGKH